ncbi:MAG: NTP transferase domain-containing protein [Bacteroidales bacterium]|nr:NTP transferase domain-containing protein [Bacteroidales bacterium]
MIFAAGLGTRLKPLTDNMPKALVPVGGRPLIRHLIEKLKLAGYDDIVVNVHHFADKLEDYIRSNDSFGMHIAFSDERDLLRDTGGGLLHARKLLEYNHHKPADADLSENVNGKIGENKKPTGQAGQFIVHNVDILSNLDFSLLNIRNDSLATLVVSERKTSRYLLFDDDMRLVGWQNVNTGEVRSPYLPGGRAMEKPEEPADAGLSIDGCPQLQNAHAYAFSGIHKISGAVFPELEAYAGEHGKVFSIIDFYLAVCDRLPIYGFDPDDFRMIDVGKLDSLSAAEAFLSGR